MRLLTAAAIPVLLAPLIACSTGTASSDARQEAPASVTSSSAAPSTAASSAAPSSAERAAARRVPALQVTRLITGLDHPWDVRQLPTGELIYTQRDRASLSVWKDGTARTLDFPSSSVWVSGETGLMGLEVDPEFATNRHVYTCQGATTSGGGHDVRVVAWRLDDALTSATRIRTVLGGFPTSSGRHGGCRLLILRDGSMLVGTGDAAIGTNPENKRSLGGKTLRLDPETGKPWPSNPFIRSQYKRTRYITTYGHRNVQGLAQRADGSLWSIEQGSFRDDEVNKLRKGGDYGWNPVPGYNEQVPMTDFSLPGKQIGARWRSGNPTLATSGGSFVNGSEWGAYDGALTVAVQKSERVLFLSFDKRGKLQKVRTPDVLRQYGRIRTTWQLANGDLLVATDNGNGEDAILRVRPA